MSVIDRFGSWAKSYYEYLTTSDQPPTSEILDAACTVGYVDTVLVACKKHIKRKFPHDIEAIRLIDEIRQTFPGDLGGHQPHEMLSSWYDNRIKYRSDQRIFETAEQKRAMVKIWERWHDEGRIEQEFWALKLKDRDDCAVDFEAITEERVLQLKQFFRDWLKTIEKIRIMPSKL
jgi:hypothetical protein